MNDSYTLAEHILTQQEKCRAKGAPSVMDGVLRAIAPIIIWLVRAIERGIIEYADSEGVRKKFSVP